jgi:hypothetical protein
MGTPAMSAKGLLGSLLDANRAGITTMKVVMSVSKLMSECL